ncbi:MAG: hypothetical protein KW793_01095 [Candidatus Doudnabacteria bacterium]|nr:hypothetical protein [Candidatus Doudnabacteria bacterium]
MKKFLILVAGLSLTAASCNILGGGSGPKGVFKSEDGGQTFIASNKLDKKGDINGLNVNTLTYDPIDPDVMYIGSSSGIHKTEDAAATWKFILTGIRVGDIAIDPSKTDIIYAAGVSGDNGRILKTIDGGATWKDIYVEPTKKNPVLSLGISPANSRIILAGLNNGEIIRSTDEGNTWQLVRDLANPIIDLDYSDYTTAHALAQSKGLFTTTDQGSNWSEVPSIVTLAPGSQVKTSSANVYYDAVYDSKLKGVIFLATQQGLLRSVDNGATWSLMTLPVTNETLTVSSAAVNPTNSNNIIIAIGSTMFKTLNGGVTWETRKLPTQQPVMQILINPQEPNNIYLGMGTR